MGKYYEKSTGYEIEAERFEIGNMDKFLEFIGRECKHFVIHGFDAAEISFSFGRTKKLLVLKGDYVVKGAKIMPETVPFALHEIHVMKENDFCDIYTPEIKE